MCLDIEGRDPDARGCRTGGGRLRECGSGSEPCDRERDGKAVEASHRDVLLARRDCPGLGGNTSRKWPLTAVPHERRYLGARTPVLRIEQWLPRDGRRAALAQDVDVYARAGHGVRGAQVSERDAFVQGVAEDAGGDRADAFAACVDAGAVGRIGRARSIENQRHGLPRGAQLRLREQRLASCELRFLQVDETRQRSLEWREAGLEICLPAAVALVDAQAVERVQAKAGDAEGSAGTHELRIDAGKICKPRMQLPAELARVGDAQRPYLGGTDADGARRQPWEVRIGKVIGRYPG